MPLPVNIEAEEATLGSILINEDCLLSLALVLRPDDFYREIHAWIYEAILAVHGRKEPIDHLSVSDELDKRGKLQAVGGQAYLVRLMNAVPTSINAEHYAHIVTRTANNRRLAELGGAIANVACQDGDAIEAYSKVMQMVRDLPLSGRKVESAGGKNLRQEMLYDIAQMQMDKESRVAGGYEASWPWREMNNMARWRIGQPAALVAEGGAGKTAFCMAVATHNAINGGRVFYAATEDHPRTLRLRQIATMSGIPFRQIEAATYDEDTVSTSLYGVHVDIPAKLMASIKTVDSWRGSLHFLPVTGRTMAEIIYDLSRLEAEVGQPDAVIMDWFLDHKSRSGDNVVIGYTNDILDLKTYSSDHKTRLLIATQTGKIGAGKARLTSYDTMWTSAFAHYGKLVMSLKRERETVDGQPIGKFKPEIEVFISKANLDQTGSFKLQMRGETLSIYEPPVMNLGYAYD